MFNFINVTPPPTGCVIFTQRNPLFSVINDALMNDDYDAVTSLLSTGGTVPCDAGDVVEGELWLTPQNPMEWNGFSED